ncbi:glycosyl transferase group 1 [Desulfosudis oleivorans Hxd3]|uniref:Glycosyl transferase group 1 n=1 Tax=Desulfosudis oleivorans (strain DSM 6200 / JCM 39069 / Hxd3) TaxID=96561 RepID=A9A104_DESOH|nr:glycosyl transferase group 1 [Desulfosudis oleivorans Hxd3]
MRIFKKQCISLYNAGFDVTYVVPGTGDKIFDGVKFSFIRPGKNLFQRLVIKPYKIYKAAVKLNADIYHFHDPELIPYGYLLLKAGHKVIYDIHEDLENKIKDRRIKGLGYLLPFFAAYVGKIEKYFCKRFTYNITVNQDIKTKLNIKNVEIVTNYPIVELFKRKEADNVRSINDEFTVVYAGLLNRIRGIKEIVDAMSFLRGTARLLLLGKWQDKLYQDECMHSEGWKYTEFKGFLPLEEAYDVIQNSDVGVVNFYPLKNHLFSMPNKAFEYMAAGKPMVMSNFDYWKDLFADCALFSNPENSEEIAANIEKLASDRQLFNELSKNAKFNIENKYSWESESRKLIEAYRRISC